MLLAHTPRVCWLKPIVHRLITLIFGSAYKASIDPQSFTDRVSQNFRDLSKLLNFSNDDFIRTTEQRHKVACQALWKKLVEAGAIYLGSYSGWYAVRDEAYYAESELTDGPKGKKGSEKSRVGQEGVRT